MLEGEGGEQDGKCGGESTDGGRSWEETERTAQIESGGEIPSERT